MEVDGNAMWNANHIKRYNGASIKTTHSTVPLYLINEVARAVQRPDYDLLTPQP